MQRWEKGSLRAAAALSAAAFAAVAASVGTQPARAAAVGVVPDLSWGTSAATQDQSILAVTDLGARWVRLSIQWKNVEQTLPGVYDAWWLAHLDRAVDVSSAAGLRIVLMVYDAPSWASGSASRNTPRDPADYARFVRFLASRYVGKVHAYEVWNEQNTSRFWSSGPSPSAYTALLRAAYTEIKAADVNAKVVFGGLSTSDYRFVEGSYAAGARGSFDVMAVHPYTYCGTGAPDDVRRGSDGRITRDSFLGYREVRASMVAAGDAKPIWVTEFGWNTSTAVCDPSRGMWQGGVSEQTQADYTARAFELFAQDPYVEIAAVYNLRNNYWSGDADAPEARYGLMTTSFAPKPAFYAVQAVAGRAPQPPAPNPDPPAGNAPPTVTLTSPLDGSTFGSSLTMSASAADDRAVVKVEFRVDGSLIRTDTDAPYSFRWNGAKKLPRGTHRVEARAHDADGLTATDGATVTRK